MQAGSICYNFNYMAARFNLSGKTTIIAVVLLALLGIGATGLLLFGRGGSEGPPQAAATPTPQTLARVESTPTSRPTDTPEPPTNTPIPPTNTLEPTATAAAAPTEPPPPPLGEQTGINPAEAGVILVKSPTPVPPAPPPTATPAPAAKQQPSVPTLPNGVRYGDRTPNLANRIVRIAAPSIKLDTKVYEVYATKKGEWEVAEYAAGHHYNSKNPGEGGNIVLSGHNNWKGEVFRYLELFKPGDIIQVWTQDGKEYKYQVAETRKLLEKGATYAQRLENGKVMEQTPYEQLTLISCWPYVSYTHRLIVVAKPVE